MRLLLSLVLAAWLLTGCGSGGAQMSATTAATLQRDVDAVKSATNASHWDAAVSALDQLEADVAAAQQSGALSEQRAAQIRSARVRVLEDVQRIRIHTPHPTPTSAPSGSTTTRPAPSAKPDRNDGTSNAKPGKPNDKNKAQKGRRHGKGSKG
ncbi:MAG TPA: hypothetical protein VFP34_17650 [Microlunatus sp.]|nr:hypothetical protein [Microlunatus sp.]